MTGVLALRHGDIETDRGHQILPGLRQQGSRPAEEPLQVAASGQEHPAQDEPQASLGVARGICDGQARTPGAAEDDPLLHAEMSTQSFHVAHQGRGIVPLEAAARQAAAAASLVEQHDARRGRIEEPTLQRGGATARAAVQHHDGESTRIAAYFIVDAMPLADIEQALVVRFYRRVEEARVEGVGPGIRRHGHDSCCGARQALHHCRRLSFLQNRGRRQRPCSAIRVQE